MKSITVRYIATMFAFGLLAFGVASARYPAPELVAIGSPASGTVVIAMEVRPGENGQFGAFLVFRREGKHTTTDKFEALKRAGYPQYFMDTVGSTEITSEEGLLKLTVSGLKSGTYSFYVTQGTPWQSGSGSEPSNVLTVHVNGNSIEDGYISGAVVPGEVAGVDDAVAVEQLSVYPNPAMKNVNIPIGEGGPAMLRVFSADGGVVLNQPIETGASDYRLDVAALPAGVYHVEVVRSAKISRARFTVVR